MAKDMTSGSDSPQVTSTAGKKSYGVMGKEKSSKSGGEWGVKGGTGNHMLSKTGANPQTPGSTTASGGALSTAIGAKGGSGNHMLGHMSAGPQEAGVTQTSPKGDGGKFASGGSGKMFGNRGSLPAVGGQTSQN